MLILLLRQDPCNCVAKGFQYFCWLSAPLGAIGVLQAGDRQFAIAQSLIEEACYCHSIERIQSTLTSELKGAEQCFDRVQTQLWQLLMQCLLQGQRAQCIAGDVAIAPCYGWLDNRLTS